jgi:hypothetical protein
VQEQRDVGTGTTDLQVPVGVQLPGIVTRDAGRPAATRAPAADWRVAGIGVRVESEDAALAVSAAGARRAFARGTGAPDVTVAAAWGDLDEPAAGPAVFDSGGVWSVAQDAREFRFSFRSPTFGRVPYKTARFRRDFTSGAVILHREYFDPAAPADPLEYPLDELLITGFLASRGGVELHGCGVADGPAGLLFLGHSGAGKSTMASLWRQQPGVTVLGDDRIIVRGDGARMLMHGTPWHGDEPAVSPGPVELTKIFLLRQAAGCATRPLAGAAAGAELFARAFPPFYSADAIGAVVLTLERLARSTPCAELSFPNGPAAIEHVRALA